MYSLPSRQDIDPTALLAPFYFIFFGLMLSDAAYGIILSVGCALILKKFRLEGTMYRMIKMFFYCGISTFIWGALFGGWFGDFFTVAARTMFDKELVISPLWFNPLEEPMKLLIFSLIPLIDTVRYSFFEYYRSGIKEIGPNFIGMQNYISLLKSDMLKYAGNTLILWLIGFVPQIVVALLLANWFSDVRLKIRGKQFFKVVIYLPNLIMASAFAMLFFAMFSTNGPINSILMSLGWISEPVDFLGSVMGTRSLVGLMNFLMWFGNTTIMLMAAIMGISPDIFEACELDGCTSIKRFYYITLPLIRPILAYTLITSIIGGLQMFDVPQILTNGQGNPDRTSMTLIMFLNNHLKSRNYGMAGALSVYLFIVSGILCFFVYRMTNGNNDDGTKRLGKKQEKYGREEDRL